MELKAQIPRCRLGPVVPQSLRYSELPPDTPMVCDLCFFMAESQRSDRNPALSSLRFWLSVSLPKGSLLDFKIGSSSKGLRVGTVCSPMQSL